MAYRVTAPYVTVEIAAAPGEPLTTLGFYKGAILPGNVDEASARRQVAKGMVERFTPAPAEPAAEVETTGPVRPAKNASHAAWVAFAVSQRDADVPEEDARAEAEALKHAELIAKFGG